MDQHMLSAYNTSANSSVEGNLGSLKFIFKRTIMSGKNSEEVLSIYYSTP